MLRLTFLPDRKTDCRGILFIIFSMVTTAIVVYRIFNKVWRKFLFIRFVYYTNCTYGWVEHTFSTDFIYRFYTILWKTIICWYFLADFILDKIITMFIGVFLSVTIQMSNCRNRLKMGVDLSLGTIHISISNKNAITIYSSIVCKLNRNMHKQNKWQSLPFPRHQHHFAFVLRTKIKGKLQ